MFKSRFVIDVIAFHYLISLLSRKRDKNALIEAQTKNRAKVFGDNKFIVCLMQVKPISISWILSNSCESQLVMWNVTAKLVIEIFFVPLSLFQLE